MLLKTLRGRLILLFIAFGTLVLISVSAMVWGLETQKQDALVINLAGRQRMLAQQMARLAFEDEMSALFLEVDEGQFSSSIAIKEVEQTFDQTLAALLDGGEAPYFPDTTVTLPATQNPEIRAGLEDVAFWWGETRTQMETLHLIPHNDPAFGQALYLVKEKSSILAEKADLVVQLYEKDANAKLIRLRAMQIGFLIIAMGLLAAGATVTHKSILKPLQVLSRATVRLGMNDLDTPVQVENPEEMRLLAKSFDSMRKNLQASRQELVELNENLEDRVDQRTHELEMLNEISREISSRLDIQQVLDSVTDKARLLINGEVASLCLLDENHRWLKMQALSGEKSAVHGKAIKVENDLAENILGSTEGLLCGSGTCRGACGILTDEYRTSHVAAPLVIGDQVIGALCVGSAGSGQFEDESAKMLNKLANTAAVALENARLYSQAERVATLEERNRIAAEMHDGIGQTLSYLGLMTDQVVEFLTEGQSKEAFERLKKAREKIDQVALDLRFAINQLVADSPIKQDLSTNLEKSIREFGLQYQMTIVWRNELNKPTECSRETSEQVTKIVSEALTNAMRHARASQISVTLGKQGEVFEVTVCDDGLGFLAQNAKKSGHFGLDIMQARATHINGTVTIKSEPGIGSQVCLKWPVKEKGKQ